LGVAGAAGEGEAGEHAFAAAVGDLEEEGAVATGRVAGFEDVEVRGELDEALLVARREQEVGDGGVLGQGGVDGEAGLGDDALVGAGGAEGFAGEDVGAVDEVDGRDGGLERQQGEEQGAEEAQHSGSDSSTGAGRASLPPGSRYW